MTREKRYGVQVNFLVEPELLERAEKVAQKLELSKSWIYRKAIDDFLRQYENGKVLVVEEPA